MRTSYGRCFAALLGLLCTLVAAPVAAYSYVMLDDEALFTQSEGVARVQVIGVEPAAGGALETRYRVRVADVLAGAALGATEWLALPGTHGAPGGDWVVPGVPHLRAGDRLLLFHLRRADGLLQPVQLALGLFGEVRSATGRYYMRALQGSREFDPWPGSARLHAAREADAFEAWLRQRDRGAAAAPDYLREGFPVPQPTILAPAPGSLAGRGPLPTRWRLVSKGHHVETLAESLQDALRAVADSGSLPTPEVFLESAACDTARSGSAHAGSGLVCDHDPAELIGGAYRGGGTLALAAFRTGPGATGSLIVLQQGALAEGSAAAAGEVLAHALENAAVLAEDCAAEDLNACVALGAPRLGGSAPAASPPVQRSDKGAAPTPPGPPGNLRGAVDGTRVLLDWDPAVALLGVQFYRVQLCTGSGCVGFLPDPTIINAPATSFDYVGLAASTTYRFRVVAIDTLGQESAPSNAIELTTGVDVGTVALTNGVAVGGLGGPARGERRFTLQVPAGASDLAFRLAGGTGDADLYVRAGSQPDTSTFDCRSNGNGNDEVCTVAAPVAGTYFVLVRGFSPYDGAALTGSFTAAVPTGNCASPCIFLSGFEP